MRRTWRFRVYEAEDGWRWCLRATNGRIVAASSEAFSSMRRAEENAILVRYGLSKVDLIEVPR